MKNNFLTFLIWLFLLFSANEVTRLAYNFIYYPLINPLSGAINYGSLFPDILLLLIYFIVFTFCGYIISWQMKGSNKSIVLAIFIGVASLAIEISIHIPWFQLKPSHPVTYDYFLAFIGSLTPALAGAIGNQLYLLINAKNYKM